MRYGFGCDHAGSFSKRSLVEELVAAGHEVRRHGHRQPERTDFTIYAAKVAQGVSGGGWTWAYWCAAPGWAWASGQQVPGSTGGLVSDCYSARMARRHNDANILCLGGRVLGPGLAVELLRAWLPGGFRGGPAPAPVEMMRADTEVRPSNRWGRQPAVRWQEATELSASPR